MLSRSLNEVAIVWLPCDFLIKFLGSNPRVLCARTHLEWPASEVALRGVSGLYDAGSLVEVQGKTLRCNEVVA